MGLPIINESIIFAKFFHCQVVFFNYIIFSSTLTPVADASLIGGAVLAAATAKHASAIRASLVRLTLRVRQTLNRALFVNALLVG